MDIPGLLETLAPKGILHVVGAVLEPMPIPAFPLMLGQKSIAVHLSVIRRLLTGCSPSVPAFHCSRYRDVPMSKVNDALEHLRAGKARYRIVLANDRS